jgi:hypothetical protein
MSSTRSTAIWLVTEGALSEISCVNSATVSMASIAFALVRALLDKHMNEALAEHQGDFAMGLRGSHNSFHASICAGDQP